MKFKYVPEERLHQFIQSALQEDRGSVDHTSWAVISETQKGAAQLLVKQAGIMAGIVLAKKIYATVDKAIAMEVMVEDGTTVKAGQCAFIVSGNVRTILSTERLVLNCMQRMSGIATYTHYLKTLMGESKAQLVDTRKTTPNARVIEKWAVAIGGGMNHRFGLYDKILLKDNHIDFAGSIKNAITKTISYLEKNQLDLEVEIEVRNLEEVEQVLAIEKKGVDIIMLDNMSIQMMHKAVQLIDGRFQIEASGSINEKNIHDVAYTGVDYISVGALTHSVKSMDMSLKALC